MNENIKRDCSTCVRGGVGGSLCLGCKTEKYKNWESKSDDCANNDETCSLCSQCDNVRYFEQKRKAATHEPAPTGTGSKVLHEFVEDVYARADAGYKKYGTYLRINNGRDALIDAYQECLDMGMYLKQAIMERSNWDDKIRCWAEARGLYDAVTPYSQCQKMIEETIEWLKEASVGDRQPTKSEMLEIGDMLIVLTNIANSRGVSLQECGWLAYEKIKERTGYIKNGTFVRDGDQR